MFNEKNFSPDFNNLVDAAYNRAAKRLPIYDHIVSTSIMETILNYKFAQLESGDESEQREYFRTYCEFFKSMGYDAVIYEACITQILPGGGALGGHKEGVIKTREDFNKYQWEDIPEIYFKKFAHSFKILTQSLPSGMKVLGGVGNGVFECVQDLTGYMDLCYIKADDPELYADLFEKIGSVLAVIWKRFLVEFGDSFCVCRFGDDLGFKSDTLISHDDVKEFIIPQYKKIIDIVHLFNKPFLLHSCGQIFSVMDDLIEVAGINAKHSNEDVIARFEVWVERYGERIGNFGGVDTDVICSSDEKYIKQYTLDVIKKCMGHGGVAIGTGNSVPNYVSPEGYLAMVNTVREYRNTEL